MRYRELNEKIVVRGQTYSDADGKMREASLHLNPSRQEFSALIERSIEGAVRGLVRQDDGAVVVWDAYLVDHAGADELLRQHGYTGFWPRFVVQKGETFIRAYLDHGVDAPAWQGIPTRHLARMIGTDPEFMWE